MDNRSTKIIAVAALLIAIVGVTIGFAAFSDTLVIESSAEVNPDDSMFDVNFSLVNGSENAGTLVPDSQETVDAVGSEATIDNTDVPTVKNIKAKFTKPGQKVVYNFYAHNAGEYQAYLNAVTFKNATDSTFKKVCTALEGTRQDLVNAACNDISVSVKVGSTDLVSDSVPDINGHLLNIDSYEPVKLVIEYLAKDNNTLADGDFLVTFGNIELLYQSAD